MEGGDVDHYTNLSYLILKKSSRHSESHYRYFLKLIFLQKKTQFN